MSDEFEYDYFEPEDLNSLLAEGEGKYRIMSVIAKTSSKGNAMLELTFEVVDKNGKIGDCREYLVRGNDEDTKKRLATKIRNIANSINKPQLYAKGYKLRPLDLAGEGGKCEIKTQQGDAKYPSKSVISKYIKHELHGYPDQSQLPDDQLPF